jgi:DNA polymerase-3 subunit delta'
MSFDAILGQEAAVGTLRRALATGRVHHAYRFEGPPGVGKEMAALAFAQSLVCATPPPAGQAFAACGRCSACTRAVTFARESPQVPLHPDVVFIERGLYAPETLRRSRPETQDISVDQIRRLVLEHASYPPHEGHARIFLVRRADELSISAAHALLKTLEEPIAATYFVLITTRGNELPTTVRSRTQLVRFGPLPEKLVASILEKKGVSPDIARTAAERSGGSASLALELADPDAGQERESFIEGALSAIGARDLAAAISLSDARARDKDVLYDRLGALATRFARMGRTMLAEDEARAVRAARHYEVVTEAMKELEANASPALVVESMVARLRSDVY